MDENSFDYDLWKSEIYDGDDEVIYDEIVKCISSGAFRSAVIMINVSVVESLYRKLEILAESNKKIRDDLVNYNKDNNDYLLVEYAKKYSLINSIEFDQLMTIRSARNEYAHPSFKSPSKEEVISYLYFAIRYVLSRPPYFSFMYAQNLIENHLARDRYYFEGKNDIQIRNYAINFFERLDYGVLNPVLKLFFKSIEELFNGSDESKSNCIRQCLIYTDVLFSTESITFSDEEYNDCLDKYRYASCQIFSRAHNWVGLDFRSKSRVFSYCADLDSGMLSEKEFIEIFYPLYKSDLLDDEFLAKFGEIWDGISLKLLLECDFSERDYYDKIIFYFKSHNWYNQNSAVNALHKLNLDNFTDSQLEEIGRNILQSADGEAWDCEDILKNLHFDKNKKFLITPILQGISYEVFINNDDVFRYKGKYCEEVLRIIHDFEDSEIILKNLNIHIGNSKPKFEDFNKFSDAIRSLNDLKNNEEGIEREIESIMESINVAIGNYINVLFDEDAIKLLKHRNSWYISTKIYSCLNEEKRELFSNLASSETLLFLKFFYKRNNLFNIGKIEFEFNFVEMERFIGFDDIKSNVEELLASEDLAQRDKVFLNRFLEELTFIN